MCVTPSAPDNGADQARAAEDARQARIASGTVDVNNQFAKFDDNYFGTQSKAYTDFYNPQVNDQYKDARRALVLNLGRSGILNGSAGARELGKIDEKYQTEKAGVADRGVSYGNQIRGDVANNKSQVLGQLSASADPAAAAADASARAQTLTAPAAFSPLSSLFADFGTQAGIGISAEKAGYRGFDTGLFRDTAPLTGRGSSRNVY